MDKRQGSSADASWRRSSPLDAASGDNPSTIHGEHIDSPMRKRPRLDGLPAETAGTHAVPASATTTDQEDTVEAVDTVSSPDASVSSRITLNLRSMNPSMSSRGAKQRLVNPAELSPSTSTFAFHESVDLTTESAPPSPHSPPVVEIEVDDSDNINDNTYSRASESSVTGEEEPDVFRDFPMATRYGIMEASHLIAIGLGGKDWVDPELLSQIGDWLQKWLRLSHDRSSRLRRYYSTDHQFWTNIAIIYSKILNRRSLASGLLRSFDGSRLLTIIKFFGSYVALVAEIVGVDVCFLKRLASDPDATIEFHALRHLKNLETIFRPNADEIPLWRIIRLADIDVEKIQITWAMAAWVGQNSLLQHLAELTNLLTQQVKSNPPLSTALSTSARAFQSLARLILSSRRSAEQSVTTPPLDTLIRDATVVFQTLNAHVESDLSKDTSTFPVDVNIHVIMTAVDLSYELASRDVTAVQGSNLLGVGMHNLSGDDVPRCVREEILRNLLWKCIVKGRMELRIQALVSLSQALVQLWKDRGEHKSSATDPTLEAAVAWIKSEHVLEYLFGIESHPQLLANSRDIIGFLLVRKRWTLELTDLFVSTVVGHQDRRIVAAAIDTLRSTLNLADVSQVVGFCQKLTDVPAHLWSPELRFFLRMLLDQHACKNSSDGQQAAIALCVRLLQNIAKHRTSEELSAEARNLHGDAYTLLAVLSQQVASMAEREAVYRSCFDNIKSGSESSCGSVEAILAFSCHHHAEDLTFLAQQRELCAELIQQVCSMIKRDAGNLSKRPTSTTSIVPYLELLKILIISFPRDLVPGSLEITLWDHLLGEEACGDELRNISWGFASDIAAKTDCKSNGFIRRLLHEFLPTLSRQRFTTASLKFFEINIGLADFLEQSSISANTEIVEIPLFGLLWNVMLETANEYVAHHCIALLSQCNLEYLTRHALSPLVVAASHNNLIDGCFAVLKSPAVSGTRDSDTVNHDQRFSRTIRFMQKFLADVKSRPFFSNISIRSEHRQSAAFEFDNEESALCLKYQAFGSGLAEDVKELKLARSSTFSILAAQLRRVTGVDEIAVISGGAPIDLEANPATLAETLLPKGLLIVRNIGKKPEVGARNIAVHTVAEVAVLRHFDTLFGFLDLPEMLSMPVFELMRSFPPHQRIFQDVMHNPSKMQQLLPADPHCRTRTLYSIQSLKRGLDEQLNLGALHEKYATSVIEMLTMAFTNPAFKCTYMGSSVDEELVELLTECLLNFLKERPVSQEVLEHLNRNLDFVHEVYILLNRLRRAPLSRLWRTGWMFYAVIIEASFHSIAIWDAFTRQDDLIELHQWLLLQNPYAQARENVRACIESICSNSTSSTTDLLEACSEFYWQLLQPLILMSDERPAQSAQLLAISNKLFLSHGAAKANETALRTYLESWMTLLNEYRCIQASDVNYVDPLLLGVVRLLGVGVSFFKSFKIPLADSRLIEVLITRFLFPPTSDELTSDSPAEDLTPILNETMRREVYGLALSLIEDVQICSRLVGKLADLVTRETRSTEPFWLVDRARWLRTALGYSGLSNLTNTCYMNSILCQLFMNIHFRRFFLSIKPIEQLSSAQHKLLLETQSLFSEMQEGNSKFSATNEFAHSIRPYDSEHINVTVQMDVDEFYNLLFDRWENEMPDSESKTQFRSFYGGQLVTQVKSAGCDHISERKEPFFAIQCDVKGKTSLGDSLQAYIEGDAMEGENKYKCEACGGRLVNAVKRSCLSELPDNIIFHLKRFDFDLVTLQRSKINDEFQFPKEIDMTPYHVDHLKDPENHNAPDIYELRGVLVHNGTAETGHYYSYIRLPGASNSMTTWAEFNDTEVLQFDPNKIPDQCFGGAWVQRDPSSGEQYSLKSYNAYMLFYQRSTASAAESELLGNHPLTGPIRSVIPETLAGKILLSNEALFRRYYLYGPAHAQFVKSLVPLAKNLRNGPCSEYHELENSLTSVIMSHVTGVFARVKDASDFESGRVIIKRICTDCVHCAAFVLDWIILRPEVISSMVLQSPNLKVRSTWGKLMVGIMRNLRDRDPQLYGIEPSSDNDLQSDAFSDTAPFPKIVRILQLIYPELWKLKGAWNDYFDLLTGLCQLGTREVELLLDEEVFQDAVELVLCDPGQKSAPTILSSRRNLDNRQMLLRNKSMPHFTGLLHFVHSVLQRLDLFPEEGFADPNYRRHYDTDTQKFAAMNVESKAVTGPKERTKVLPFISRIIELMEFEVENPVWWPGQIIATLLESRHPGQLPANICQTIIVNLDLWPPAYCGFIFKTIVDFCRACPHLPASRKLLEAAAQHTALMAKNAVLRRNEVGFIKDYDVQGGQYHLSFYQCIAAMRRVHGLNDDDNKFPFLENVINLAPYWGPPLLMFDERVVRESAVELLQSFIFARDPRSDDSAQSGLHEPQLLDTVRTMAVRDMFPRCIYVIQQAEKAHMPRSAFKYIMTVMERCGRWIENLAKQDGKTEDDDLDDAKILSDLDRVHQRANSLWRDEDDEALSETEYATADEEEDSDALTEC